MLQAQGCCMSPKLLPAETEHTVRATGTTKSPFISDVDTAEYSKKFERQDCSMRSGFSIPLPDKSVQFRRAIISQEGLKNIGQFIQGLNSDDTSGGISDVTNPRLGKTQE
jgi:hypothetical protein